MLIYPCYDILPDCCQSSTAPPPTDPILPTYIHLIKLQHQDPIHHPTWKLEWINTYEKTTVHKMVNMLLYYSYVIGNTPLVAPITLDSQQTTQTQNTGNIIIHPLNYATTNYDTGMRCHANNMIIHAQSNTSYLSKTKSQSRARGYFFLSSRINFTNRSSMPPPSTYCPTIV